MLAIISTLLALSLAGPAVATNYLNTGVHCGTTSDATLSDCQTLLNDQPTWDAAWNLGNTCSYDNPITAGGVPQVAYNTACHGNCCVYVAGLAQNQYDKYTTQDEAKSLLGCGDTDNDKINALYTFQDHGVCISNGNGCGDCFDDSDFS